MFYPGLVSVSFRGHTPEKILSAAAECQLKWIEWGSDVHAPPNDPSRLQAIVELQQRYGISCSSYGTYFRLGYSDLAELPQYIQAAKLLGTRILRLWAGRKVKEESTPQEWQSFVAQCRTAAAIAEAEDVVLCMECHRRSATETKESACALMTAVDSPAFRMYWQPNPELTIAENIAYIKLLRPWIAHVHVFHWMETERLSLTEGLEIWGKYLQALEPGRTLLLEFMPDDRIESLLDEAESLLSMTRLV